MPALASAVVRPGPRPGRSDVHRARGAGPLRLLTPRAAGPAAWIVTSSLGGGLVDGDATELDVAVHAGATCVLATQAATKVYRGASSQRVRVRVHGDGVALLVPDPLVPFRGARLTAATRLELDAGASVAASEIVTAGRVAFGERWAAAHLAIELDLAIAGRRELLDRVVLDPRHGALAARLGRFEALGTVILVGPRFADLAAAALARWDGAPVARRAPVVVSGSPIGSGGVGAAAGAASAASAASAAGAAGVAGAAGAAFRIAGARSEDVVAAARALLGPACSRCGEDPWARKW